MGSSVLVLRTALEAPGFVVGLDDLSVISQLVEKRRSHLDVAEDCGSFAECKVDRNDDRGALVKSTDQMDEKLAACLGKREIAEFVEDDQVTSAPAFSCAFLFPVD